jgi:hypothetical protein
MSLPRARSLSRKVLGVGAACGAAATGLVTERHDRPVPVERRGVPEVDLGRVDDRVVEAPLQRGVQRVA